MDAQDRMTTDASELGASRASTARPRERVAAQSCQALPATWNLRFATFVHRASVYVARYRGGHGRPLRHPSSYGLTAAELYSQEYIGLPERAIRLLIASISHSATLFPCLTSSTSPAVSISSLFTLHVAPVYHAISGRNNDCYNIYLC